MKKFMDEDFLLTTDVAKELYHGVAEQMNIIDYHCHLDPKEIAEDVRFENLTKLWLGGDHYKWRLMRSNGVSEEYITGFAPDKEKFLKFAAVLPKAIGNPMYHWCHLELRRYFDYHGILNGETAEEVWEWCNKKLQEPGMSAKGLIRQSGVTVVCTTDDPLDHLEWHKGIAKDESFDVRVLPTWRPDAALAIDREGFTTYLIRLSGATGTKIDSFSAFCDALKKRMLYFAEHGCVIADHGMERADFASVTKEKCEEIFTKKKMGMKMSKKDVLRWESGCLAFLGAAYREMGWAMQLHYGAQRENNKRLFKAVGANAGIDCIDSKGFSSKVARLLNALQEKKHLPKTILYSLNPSDNAVIGTMIGCFQGKGVEGKIQHGSAWWFNDHKTGMLEQMTSLANLGLLGNFIGMLTDSRSFTSYVRHEYFRRILCEFIGGLVENGEYPYDAEALQKLVRDVCHDNAARYFGFDVKGEEKA